jgi:hypothetical protein
MINSAQIRLEKVSPAIKIIDWIWGRNDEKNAGFAINKARDLAWSTAQKLAFADDDEFAEKFKIHDEIVYIIAKGNCSTTRNFNEYRIIFYPIKRREKCIQSYL